MAKLTPEQWLAQNSSQKTNTSTSTKLTPEQYLQQKSGTTETRTPVAKVQTPEEYLQNKEITSVVPTTAIGTVGKVGGFLAPTTTKTLGKLKKGEDITARDVVGSGLEVASYLIPGGAIAKGVGLGVKGAGLASKVATGAAIGAVSGGTFEAGQSVAEGGDVGDIAKSTLKGTAIGGAAGGAIGAIGAKLAAKKLAQKTDNITPVETPVQTTPEVIPEVTPTKEVTSKSIPKPATYTKDPVESLTKVMETELPPDLDPTFVSTSLKKQTEQYNSISVNTPVDDLIDMAMGLKQTPEGLSPVTIHTLTGLRNDLTVEQAIRLKNIYPLSKAGQELSLARLKSGAIIDNPVDMMQAVDQNLKEQVIKKGVDINDVKNLFPDCGFN